VRDLEEERTRWLADRPLFEEFGVIVRDRLKALLRDAGVYALVDSRAKTVESLIKKLILKPHHSYESLPDKVGARIVIRYLHEISNVTAIVGAAFDAQEIDKKPLAVDRVGYLGVHMDVRLRSDDKDAAAFPADRFRIEIQVHTRTQNLWADMSHDCSYKTLQTIPEELHRSVNLLAGLLEVADNEFTRIDDAVNQLPSAPEYKVLRALEPQYFKLSARPGNAELSIAVIHVLLPLYAPPPQDWAGYFANIFAKHRKELEAVLKTEDPNQSAFLFQPEILLILDRLRMDPDGLREAWDEHFPHQELQRLAVKFATPFE
jgi:ppGpp synthetase/RelA/SpoT-type nucleotidyltranferase